MLFYDEESDYSPTSRFLITGSPDSKPTSPKAVMRDVGEVSRQEVTVGHQPLKLRSPSNNDALDLGIGESSYGNALCHHVSTHTQAIGDSANSEQQPAITIREIDQKLGATGQELPTASAAVKSDKTAAHVLPFIEESKYRLSKLEDQYQRQDSA
eukprot:CAMPEP_0172799720 /NCGR_PEP_ID=MMETSP1075-20121228/2044_1 /TAXON_ID=2916 /ORGANISM="Ceratium fusus, Strain PA161109" /LENGTH=154 /DNA_ID=CAMNT_0013637449 /DNA_START=117 /DNA_END=578 /DNA_ORIENTATION=+